MTANWSPPPLVTSQANAYIEVLSLGANFATVNHMLINVLVLEAFQEVIHGATGELVCFISHNIARGEIVDGRPAWVHRKGATRGLPAGHHELKETPFHETGHPILLPGNPRDGSLDMVAAEGASETRYRVNHVAGRRMGRRHAALTLNQAAIDAELDQHEILSYRRQYPKDEAPDAHKDFSEVVRSTELAGLAVPVAKLKTHFVIKDLDKTDD